MIQLRKYAKGDYWSDKYVWVKHDHISFLSIGVFVARGRDREEYTTITTIGGGTVDVYETPLQIMQRMPARPGAQA
jgi:hypothetical protein